MGYQMPIVCKEVYLPVNYNFITDNSGSFGEFAKKYKDEYGIDLHDLFELKRNTDNNYCIHQKSISKIYAVGFQENTYPELDNVVMLGIQFDDDEVEAAKDLIIIGIGTRASTGTYSGGYGFRLQLDANDLTPANIDALRVYLWEI